MSKRTQQLQSAFNIGNTIGSEIAKTYGKVDNTFFNHQFKLLYKGAKRWQSTVRKAARIGYNNGLDKAAKAAQTEQLTGGQDAKL